MIAVDRQICESHKYHSIVRNRLHKDSFVTRSKSFQEQDLKASSNNRTRFYILRCNRRNNDYDGYQLDETISHHNIEITIEDTDADKSQHTAINSIYDRRKENQNDDSTSLNSSEVKFDRSKVRSGHMLGRIFRRMRKFSMAWKKSKNKSRTRGEFK